MLADSGLATKYWADAVQTAVYTRNFIPSSRAPHIIPMERWTGQRQDIAHLRPFGSTAYAHIPLDLAMSKWSPRSVKVVLIGYYGRDGYKLLNTENGSVVKSRDIIFEEGRTHLARAPTRTVFTNDTDPFTATSEDDVSTSPDPTPDPPKSLPDRMPTAPRPLQMTKLHSSPDADEENEAGPVVRELDIDDRPLALRREKRERKPSAKMMESLEYLKNASAHMATSEEEVWIPTTYKDAMMQPDLWMPPMAEELAMLKERGVYKVVPRPTDKNVVRSKWVYAPKFDADGVLVRRKARVVAKGFTQVLGEDYGETYASVARVESVRLVCAIAASRGMHLWQLDFVSAFLNSENTYKIYMEPPPGFEKGGEDGDDCVWLLLKTLYGTMQGAHDWANNLDRTFEGHGYYKSRADPQIRSRVVADEFTITSTWTDDVLGASTTTNGETRAKSELEVSYEIKDLGKAKYILGIRIDYDDANGTIRLSQRAYCERLLERFDMSDCRPRSTPLPAGITLNVDDCPSTEEERREMENTPYREALGSLMWLQVGTRPDLSFTINLLSRFANNPGIRHWNALKHTLGYVKGTLDYSITYYRDGNLRPHGYVDADYAGDSDTRRSTEGYIFFAAGGPVSWASKRQETVALSTVEAEYMAFTRATQQALWMDKFLDEVGLSPDRPAPIFADNNGAIATTKNNKNHRRTKHIDVKHHFVKEKVDSKLIEFTYIPSNSNLADILTKPLARDATLRCVRGIGLTDSTEWCADSGGVLG